MIDSESIMTANNIQTITFQQPEKSIRSRVWRILLSQSTHTHTLTYYIYIYAAYLLVKSQNACACTKAFVFFIQTKKHNFFFLSHIHNEFNQQQQQ